MKTARLRELAAPLASSLATLAAVLALWWLASHQQWVSKVFLPTPEAAAASLAEGQRLTLQRLDDLLDAYGVRPMSVGASPFDPVSMRVVGVESGGNAAQGTVLRESRSGYFHRGEILRIAEVIVSKKEKSV